MRRFEIPINVARLDSYDRIFDRVRAMGFSPEPYLAPASFSLRAGQDNPETFWRHITQFEKYRDRRGGDLLGQVGLVFNTRTDSPELRDTIKTVLAKLYIEGWNSEQLYLILNVPQLIDEYMRGPVRVVVSSASVASYKRVITVLTEPHLVENEVRQGKAIEMPNYVLPSTLQHLVPLLPPNSFILLLNNGCRIGCIHAATKTDHSKDCPNQSKSVYSNSALRTDLISRDGLRYLIRIGWKSFKVAGRQAESWQIDETVDYYLRDDEDWTPPDAIPYIDSHLFYGESWNG